MVQTVTPGTAKSQGFIKLSTGLDKYSVGLPAGVYQVSFFNSVARTPGYSDHSHWFTSCMAGASGVQIGSVTVAPTTGKLTGQPVTLPLPSNLRSDTAPGESAICISDSAGNYGNMVPLTILAGTATGAVETGAFTVTGNVGGTVTSTGLGGTMTQTVSNQVAWATDDGTGTVTVSTAPASPPYNGQLPAGSYQVRLYNSTLFSGYASHAVWSTSCMAGQPSGGMYLLGNVQVGANGAIVGGPATFPLPSGLSDDSTVAESAVCISNSAGTQGNMVPVSIVPKPSADCIAALIVASGAAAAAALDRTPPNIAIALGAALQAALICKKGGSSGRSNDNPKTSEPDPGNSGKGNSPVIIPIDPPSDPIDPIDVTPPEDKSEGPPCEAEFEVSWGVGVPALAADPAVASISMDWGDGITTTQNVAWGSTVTFTHNYFYSVSPYPRTSPGVGSDGDPNLDGSDFYPVRATVLQSGERSGYSFVEHVGPFAF